MPAHEKHRNGFELDHHRHPLIKRSPVSPEPIGDLTWPKPFLENFVICDSCRHGSVKDQVCPDPVTDIERQKILVDCVDGHDLGKLLEPAIPVGVSIWVTQRLVVRILWELMRQRLAQRCLARSVDAIYHNQHAYSPCVSETCVATKAPMAVLISSRVIVSGGVNRIGP